MNENKTISEEEFVENLGKAYSSLKSAMYSLHNIANSVGINLKHSSLTIKAKQENKFNNNETETILKTEMNQDTEPKEEIEINQEIESIKENT